MAIVIGVRTAGAPAGLAPVERPAEAAATIVCEALSSFG